MDNEPKKKRLSLKQEAFVDAYIENGGNASQAALVAYDCTKADAGNIGRQNLDKTYIKEVIDAKVKAIKNETADKLSQYNLIALALDGTQSDLQDDNPKVREGARKFVLEIMKYLSEQEKVVTHDNRTQNLILPKWKGTTGKSK